MGDVLWDRMIDEGMIGFFNGVGGYCPVRSKHVRERKNIILPGHMRVYHYSNFVDVIKELKKYGKVLYFNVLSNGFIEVRLNKGWGYFSPYNVDKGLYKKGWF
jgi:hypothetical protein